MLFLRQPWLHRVRQLGLKWNKQTLDVFCAFLLFFFFFIQIYDHEWEYEKYQNINKKRLKKNLKRSQKG